MDPTIISALTSRDYAISDAIEEGDSFVDHLTSYPVAVAGDLGQTVINSAISAYNIAVPAAIEAEHIDKYALMTNSIEAYTKRNEAAVEFGSFMAGVVIPGMGISKAMSLARTGAGAWGTAFRGMGLAKFNDKIIASSNRAAELARTVGRGADSYIKAKNSAALWTGTEALAENVLYEASIIALLNQHAYMEEGWNVGLSVAGIGLGTGITGYLKWARVRNTIAQTGQKLQTDDFYGAGGEVFGKAGLIGATYGKGTELEIYKSQLGQFDSAIASMSSGHMGTAIPDATVASNNLVSLKQTSLSRAQDSILAMSDDTIKAGIPVRRSADGGQDFFELIPGQEPDKFRMASNYLMGQSRQGVGITKLKGSLESTPVEVNHSPWALNEADGSYLVNTDNEFREVLQWGTGGSIKFDAALPDPVVAPWFNYSKIDRVAKAHFNAKTGVWEVDITKIKGIDTAATYLGMFSAKRAGNAKLKVIDGKRRKLLDKLYVRAAGAQVDSKLGSNMDVRFNTIAEAEAALPTFASEYQVLSRWGGETQAQGSIAAHMTKRYGQMGKGPLLPRAITQEARAIEQGVKSQGSFVTTGGLLPTHQVDYGYISAHKGLEEIIDGAHVGGKKAGDIAVDMGDLPRMQAFAIHNVKPANYISMDTFHAALKQSKINRIEEILKRFPDADDMTLSIHANAPLDIVAAVRKAAATPTGQAKITLRKVLMKRPVEEWNVYKTSKEINEATQDTTVSLLGRAKQTEDPASLVAKIDRDMMESASRQIVDDISIAAIQTSKSVLLKQLYEGFVRNETTHGIRETLGGLIGEAGAGSVWTSLDMSLRRFGELTGMLSKQGTTMQRVINEQGIKKAKEVLTPSLQRMSGDKVAIVQYEQVRNAVDALDSTEFDRVAGLRITPENKIILFPEQLDKAGAVTSPATYMKYSDGTEIVLQDSVKSLLNNMETVAKDIYAIRDTTAKLRNISTGAERRNIWFPYASPVDNLQAFVWNKSTNKITKIMARDRGTFNDMVKAFRDQNKAALAPGGTMELHLRNETDLGSFLRIKNLAELEEVGNALPSYKKSGIANTRVTGDKRVLSELVEAIDQEYVNASRNYIRYANEDIFSKLDDIEALHLADTKTNPNSSFVKRQRQVSPATMAKAALLNTSLQAQSPTVKALDDMFSLAIDKSYEVARKGWQSAQAHFERGKYNPEAFDELTQGLKAQGIPVPWEDKIAYAIHSNPELKPVAKSVVAASNAVLSTLALRLFDTSHAVVTTLTTPMLLAAEGVGAHGLSHLDASKMLMEVSKDWISQATGGNAYWKGILEHSAQQGHTIRLTSEATEAMTTALGTKSWWQRLQDTKGFKIGVSLSDHSEVATREMAYMMGYKLAKRLNPNAAPELLESSAALFTNRAMGNYTSHQRPIFFQGAGGQAIGLFQTFMWTMGQNITRYAENQQLKAMYGMMGGYATMFGVASLPGFNVVDKAIGQYSSDPGDRDITSSMYEAFGDKVNGHSRTAAEYLLYGLPSTLLQTSFWTRADLQPRLPVNEGGLPWPPIVDAGIQTAELFAGMISNAAAVTTVSESPISSLATAMAEGIATQHIFRPAARMTELALGYSIDRKGATIASGDDVRGAWPIFSRLAASRPLEEQVIRNQSFRHRLYDTAEQRKRKRWTQALRNEIRQGGNVDKVMGAYLQDGGALSGWRGILNETQQNEAGPGAKALLKSVAKQPGIAGIMEGYALD